MTTKITYKTTEGKIFKTIAPSENWQDYMREHYSEVIILSVKPSVKKAYKKVSNKSVN